MICHNIDTGRRSFSVWFASIDELDFHFGMKLHKGRPVQCENLPPPVFQVIRYKCEMSPIPKVEPCNSIYACHGPNKYQTFSNLVYVL